MNPLIYLVQVRALVRAKYDPATERAYFSDAGMIAFGSYAEAQAWTKHTVPTFLNPFLYAEDGGNYPLYRHNDAETQTITHQEMSAFVVSLGLVPPPLENIMNSTWPDETWSQWWEDTVGNMTEAQKVALWRYLVANPYRIVEVELEPTFAHEDAPTAR